MKLKTLILAGFAMISGTLVSHGAQFIINNVAFGPGDYLFATSNNSLMNSGVVAFGYFNSSSITTADVDTIPELYGQLGNFITVTSGIPGSFSTTLGGSFPGYLEQTVFTNGPFVTPGGANDALLNRPIYAIMSSAASLGSALATDEFGLYQVAIFLDDGGTENQYFADPAGRAPIIGSNGTFIGDAGGGSGTYNTFQMAVVPEPSTLLLSALGVLALLRRKR